MTAHELARRLLAGPDLPVAVSGGMELNDDLYEITDLVVQPGAWVVSPERQMDCVELF